MDNLFKNKWFWVAVLVGVDVVLGVMVVEVPLWKLRGVVKSVEQVVGPAAVKLTPTPTPKPTESPADSRGQVLGAAVNSAVADSQNRRVADVCGDSSCVSVAGLETALPTVKTMEWAPESAGMQPEVVPTTVYDDPVTIQAGQIVDDLNMGRGADLYSLMSAELTSTFSQESVEQALAQQPATEYQMIGQPVVQGEWATQTVEVAIGGPIKTFQMVLHLESGQWRLYGTI